MQEVVYTEIPDHLKFQTVFEDVNSLKHCKSGGQQKTGVHESTDNLNEVNERIIAIKTPALLPAGLKFRIDKLTARMDNEILFEGLELAQGQNKEVNQIPMGFLAKAAFTDIFEGLQAGSRHPISTNLDGAEFFLLMTTTKGLLTDAGHFTFAIRQNAAMLNSFRL